MKILIINNALGYGGAEKQVVVDANSLFNNGHDVTVAYHISGDLGNLLIKQIKKFHLKYSNSILSGFQLFFHLLFNRYDVIHTHQYWASKVGGIPGKITGHKVIYNEHGLGLWRKWYHIIIVRFISMFADKIINSCNATKDVRQKREKINKEKLMTVYNSFQIEEMMARHQLINDKRLFSIGFVGRFNHVKRLDIFIELANELKKEIKHFKIILVGDGKEKGRIDELIRINNLENYFITPGFVTDTASYYKKFDIFILPSKREAHSVALLEAGANGIPALAFNVGGNSEIIVNGKTGYIIPECNFTLMFKKIKKLYDLVDFRLEMGEFAKKYVQETFSINKRINNLISLYNKVLKS